MKRWLRKLGFQMDFENLVAEVVGVFIDRAQVGNALMAAHRLRTIRWVPTWFRRR